MTAISVLFSGTEYFYVMIFSHNWIINIYIKLNLNEIGRADIENVVSYKNLVTHFFTYFNVLTKNAGIYRFLKILWPMDHTCLHIKFDSNPFMCFNVIHCINDGRWRMDILPKTTVIDSEDSEDRLYLNNTQYFWPCT